MDKGGGGYIAVHPNPGMVRLLGNLGILGQGYMAVNPGIIPGWPRYLGIPGYLDKGVYDCPSWDNPEMARLLGNPGIVGQGGYMADQHGIIPGWPGYLGIPGYLNKGAVYGCPFRDNPEITRLLGNPGILGQGRAMYIWQSILG